MLVKVGMDGELHLRWTGFTTVFIGLFKRAEV